MFALKVKLATRIEKLRHNQRLAAVCNQLIEACEISLGSLREKLQVKTSGLQGDIELSERTLILTAYKTALRYYREQPITEGELITALSVLPLQLINARAKSPTQGLIEVVYVDLKKELSRPIAEKLLQHATDDLTGAKLLLADAKQANDKRQLVRAYRRLHAQAAHLRAAQTDLFYALPSFRENESGHTALGNINEKRIEEWGKEISRMFPELRQIAIATLTQIEKSLDELSELVSEEIKVGIREEIELTLALINDLKFEKIDSRKSSTFSGLEDQTFD